MRHGTTVWNEKGITQGRTNNRLSKKGIALTKDVAEKYSNSNFDIIYCSPLMRTVQTANLMNKFHNVKVIKDKRLIEIDQGIFTGRSKCDLTEEEKNLKFARAESCGMESYQSVYNRTKNFLLDIRNNCKFNNVLIITHNCNATFLEDLLLKIDVNFNNDNHLRSFKNAEIKQFKY
jgi:probable phosphoglycerate mutase